ncbi:DNA-binding transcriptional LysR family regulator [Phyllobacterium endophyticum]|nr:DNA-binding transcriptional LysR family regulator [Phyllobacterium endophyticum]
MSFTYDHSKSKIAALGFTLHRSSPNRTLLDAALAKSSIKLRWFYEVTHRSTFLGLVEAGPGISVLPQMARPQGELPSSLAARYAIGQFQEQSA